MRASILLKIAMNILVRISRDNLLLVAAGVAFYSMTAIFPAIAGLVSIYGMFADPSALRQEALGFSQILPESSFKLLSDALETFASKSNSTLSAALFVSLAIALWSAKAGVAALMTGLNIANETTETRGLLLQQLVGLLLTLGAVGFAAIAFAAIAVIPATFDMIQPAPNIQMALGFGRWPVLALLICFGLAIIYRFGPSRDHPKWRWITLGSAIATVLWLAVSWAFSFYVSRFGSYDATYGALAAPVVLLLWFWLSALVVLIGAEIDAEMEHGDGKTAREPPTGAP
jgi:membrane protein